MNSTATIENKTPWLQISLRVTLGSIFIWAGCAKLIDLPSFVASVSHFQIPPFHTKPWDMWLGYTLPAFEVISGSCLILGLLYRGALLSITVMSIAFLIAIYSAHSRGLNIECGCLGSALSFGSYGIHITVLAIMTLASLALIWLEVRMQKMHLESANLN